MKKLLIAAAGISLTISACIGPVLAGGNKASPTGAAVRAGIIHGRGSLIQYGSGGTTLSPGFNNVDTQQTWNCKYSSGCTIGVSAMIQLANGGDWAICAVVDGNYINPPCPYQGNLPDAGTNGYVTGNSEQNWLVSQGDHTVQTQVYVTNSTTLANWQTHQHISQGQ